MQMDFDGMLMFAKRAGKSGPGTKVAAVDKEFPPGRIDRTITLLKGQRTNVSHFWSRQFSATFSLRHSLGLDSEFFVFFHFEMHLVEKAIWE